MRLFPPDEDPDPSLDPVTIVERFAWGVENKDPHLVLSTMTPLALTAEQRTHVTATLPLATTTVTSCGAHAIAADSDRQIAAVALCLSDGTHHRRFEIMLRGNRDGWLIAAGIPLQEMFAGHDRFRIGDVTVEPGRSITTLPGTYEFEIDGFLRPVTGTAGPYLGAQDVQNRGRRR